MSHITIDDPVLSQLRGTSRVAEVRDPSGKVVGHFAPVADTEFSRYLSALAHYNPEEIARRKANPGRGYTLKEVFQHLMTLTTDPADLADLREKIAQLDERDRCDTP